MCVVTAEDGTTGIAIANHGAPVASIISEYLGPRLVNESAMATEKCYDMMGRMCATVGATGLASYAVRQAIGWSACFIFARVDTLTGGSAMPRCSSCVYICFCSQASPAATGLKKCLPPVVFSICWNNKS